jgi:hypothetical protein
VLVVVLGDYRLRGNDSKLLKRTHFTFVGMTFLRANDVFLLA